MHNVKTAATVGLLLTIALCSANAVNAGTSFPQAVALYNSGKYSAALAEFKQFATAYPTNAMSHYYMALCYQSMGNRISARQEFTLTSQYGNGSLKGYADKALKFLGGSGSSSDTQAATKPAGGVVSSNGGGTSEATAALASIQTAPVSEVLEFYTDWCHVCKEFEPVWSSTQSKVSGVQFHRYNAEDASNAALVQKYNVHAYPTLVYLDRSGNVLKNSAGAPYTAADFAQTIRFPK